MSSLKDLAFDDQVTTLERLVKALRPNQITPAHFAEMVSLARDIPPKFITPTFLLTLATTFGVSKTTVEDALHGDRRAKNEDFDAMIPKSGWLHDHIEYSRYTEPPTVFHFFSGAVVIGAALQRRVHFPKGSGDIFPNINAVLIAPSGKCRKTTACNIAVNLYRKIAGNILADKVTPEAIVEALGSQQTATALIYAPEWAVFLGKQQYMEGLVPMLTALFDCPQIWSAQTITRNATQLQNVAVSHLACSTIDWMQSSISKEAFGGGFMSRLLFIVQKDTPRRFPLPPPLDKALEKRLTDGLLRYQRVTGEMKLSTGAEAWYVSWYNARHSRTTERHFAGYFERRQDRLIQLAMVLTLSEDPTCFTIDEERLKLADKMLGWIEHYMPIAFEELSGSIVGDDQMRLLRQIREADEEELAHSAWMRMNSRRMSADVFKKATTTLLYSKMITYDKVKHIFYLLPAGRAIEL